MQMIRWMCGSSQKDRRTSEELRKLAGVEPTTTFIRRGRLRWNGHVMRKHVWISELKVDTYSKTTKDMVGECRGRHGRIRDRQR